MAISMTIYRKTMSLVWLLALLWCFAVPGIAVAEQLNTRESGALVEQNSESGQENIPYRMQSETIVAGTNTQDSTKQAFFSDIAKASTIANNTDTLPSANSIGTPLTPEASQEALPITVPPTPDAIDVVYSEEQLSDWYQDHYLSGGRVLLGDNITLTSGFDRYDAALVVIDTGNFGITYDGASLDSHCFELSGTGVEVPVLTIIDAGTFRMSWLHTVQAMRITATGSEVDGEHIGGTALRVTQDNGWPVSYEFFLAEGSIRACGNGAVGVELSAPIDLYCLNVYVEGSNSTAVWAPNGANLFYCVLQATGFGATCVEGINIRLDTCKANTLKENIENINRRIIGIVGSRLYVPVYLYEQQPDLSQVIRIQFLLDGSEAVSDRIISLLVNWDLDVLEAIDFSIDTATVITGSLAPPFDALDLCDSFPLQLTVDVRDPLAPCISNLIIMEVDKALSDGDLLNQALFEIWDTAAWHADELILWRSDDEGETWYDVTHADDIEWRVSTDEGRHLPFGFAYHYSEVDSSIWFQLEVPGFGESNIATLYSQDGQTFGGAGGDRTGADRVIGSAPPADTPPKAPPSETTPPNDTVPGGVKDGGTESDSPSSNGSLASNGSSTSKSSLTGSGSSSGSNRSSGFDDGASLDSVKSVDAAALSSEDFDQLMLTHIPQDDSTAVNSSTQPQNRNGTIPQVHIIVSTDRSGAAREGSKLSSGVTRVDRERDIIGPFTSETLWIPRYSDGGSYQVQVQSHTYIISESEIQPLLISAKDGNFLLELKNSTASSDAISTSDAATTSESDFEAQGVAQKLNDEQEPHAIKPVARESIAATDASVAVNALSSTADIGAATANTSPRKDSALAAPASQTLITEAPYASAQAVLLTVCSALAAVGTLLGIRLRSRKR